jgi:ketol-acid reductoisomerase
LNEIQNGEYARKWIAENENGREWFEAERRRQQDHLIERVGADLRQMMPFVKPVTIKPGE